MDEDIEVKSLSVESINDEFEKYQEELLVREKKLKLITNLEVEDDFYKLIDDVCGTELSKI